MWELESNARRESLAKAWTGQARNLATAAQNPNDPRQAKVAYYRWSARLYRKPAQVTTNKNNHLVFATLVV
jgi:hypothetical protein